MSSIARIETVPAHILTSSEQPNQGSSIIANISKEAKKAGLSGIIAVLYQKYGKKIKALPVVESAVTGTAPKQNAPLIGVSSGKTFLLQAVNSYYGPMLLDYITNNEFMQKIGLSRAKLGDELYCSVAQGILTAIEESIFMAINKGFGLKKILKNVLIAAVIELISQYGYDKFIINYV